MQPCIGSEVTVDAEKQRNRRKRGDQMKLREGMQELGMDVDVTLNRFMNNENMYRKFLKKTEDDPTYEELEDAVKRMDYEIIERSAHTLKGVAGNMGFDQLMNYCAALVADVREKRFDDIGDDFDHVQKEHTKVVEVIRKIED